MEFLGAGWRILVGTIADLPDMCLCLPVTLPATIMTSSVPTTVGGHMMYPSPHAVMYAPTSGLADGSLTVLNAFSQAPSTMQVSHSQVQEQGELMGKAEERRIIASFTHVHIHVQMPPTQIYTLTHVNKLGYPYIYLHMHTRMLYTHSSTHACPVGNNWTLALGYIFLRLSQSFVHLSALLQ